MAAQRRKRTVRRREKTSDKRTKKGIKKTVKKEEFPIPAGLPYDIVSYILFFAGLIIGISGFYLMWKGDDILSVLTIVIGYVILIPIALYRRGKNKKGKASTSSQ